MGTTSLPETRTDDLGQYIAFIGKFCRVWAVQLTNRNRYTDQKLLCLEHGREKERARVRIRNRSAVRPVDSADKAPCIPPLAKPFHVAVTAWLNNPSDSESTNALKSAMCMYELNFLLKKRLPPLPLNTAQAPAGLQGIAIEEPQFDNPEHRSTRLEFLADCKAYGA
jgi:hypothetical protein